MKIRLGNSLTAKIDNSKIDNLDVCRYKFPELLDDHLLYNLQSKLGNILFHQLCIQIRDPIIVDISLKTRRLEE
jgi:hypothetical protein